MSDPPVRFGLVGYGDAWFASDRDSRGTVKLATDVGSSYIEIYQEDLLIPELARFTEDIHRELKARIQQSGRPLPLTTRTTH